MTKRNLFFLQQITRWVVAGAALVTLGIQGATAGSGHSMTGMEGMQSGAAAGKFSFGETGKASDVGRTIKVTMNTMSFEPKNITVMRGETIRFVVTNKSVLEHDFTIGDEKTQTAHRAEMAKAMEQGGSMEHGDDPNAMTVKAGQTRQLIWKFSRVGTLQFDCNVPGHYKAGMAGTIDVQKSKAGKA